MFSIESDYSKLPRNASYCFHSWRAVDSGRVLHPEPLTRSCGLPGRGCLSLPSGRTLTPGPSLRLHSPALRSQTWLGGGLKWQRPQGEGIRKKQLARSSEWRMDAPPMNLTSKWLEPLVLGNNFSNFQKQLISRCLNKGRISQSLIQPNRYLLNTSDALIALSQGFNPLSQTLAVSNH